MGIIRGGKNPLLPSTPDYFRESTLGPPFSREVLSEDRENDLPRRRRREIGGTNRVIDLPPFILVE